MLLKLVWGKGARIITADYRSPRMTKTFWHGTYCLLFTSVTWETKKENRVRRRGGGGIGGQYISWELATNSKGIAQ